MHVVFIPEGQKQMLAPMYNLVQDMGREIARMESPWDIWKPSGLFNTEEVRDVLQGNEVYKFWN